MKALATSMIALALVGLAGSLAQADEKIDKAKLIGTWKIVKADDADKGATFQFTKDGKVIVAQVDEDTGKKFAKEGTYALDGDKLTVVIKQGANDDKKVTFTITTLSADKLVLDNKDGKTMELEKVK